MEYRPFKDRNSRARGPASTGRNKSCDEKPKAVFVRNIPYAIKEKELLEHFKGSCDVTGCKILKDTDGKSRGCGFIDFSTSEEAEKALLIFNGSQLRGRKIKVEMKRGRRKPEQGRSKGHAQDQSDQSPHDRPDASVHDRCSVWIGTYPQTATENKVKDHISNLFGTFVTTTRLVRKPWGNYGIVTFDTPDSAQCAYDCMSANSPFFRGIRLQVHGHKDKPVSDPDTRVDRPGVRPALPVPSQDAISVRLQEQKNQAPKPPAGVKPMTHAQSQDSSPSARCCTVLIGKFSLSTREDDLKVHLLKHFGNCAIAVRIVCTTSGKYGSVTFDTSANAQKTCLSMDGTVVLGIRIQVHLGTSKPGTCDPDTFTSPKVDDKPISPPTPPVPSKDVPPRQPSKDAPSVPSRQPSKDASSVPPRQPSKGAPSVPPRQPTRGAPSVPPRKPKPEIDLPKCDHTGVNEPRQNQSGQSALDSRRSSACGCGDVWIGAFPETTTDDDLKAYLSKLFGTFPTLSRIVHSSWGKYGVASFDSLDDARGICSCLGIDDGYHLGSLVQVRFSRTNPGTGIGQPVSRPTPPIRSRGASLSPGNQQTRKYSHSDPLVTRLMCTKLMKKIQEVAESLHVKVTPTNECDSLTLSGPMEAVADVNSQLVFKAKEVENSLIETLVTVDSIHVKALPVDSLKAQLCHLEKDRTVCIKKSDQCVQKSAVKETQPSRSNICKLQIAKGNLSDEVADAIVCPITTDFLPQPGLTEDAIKAGGKSLREEIQKYQTVCGTLKATTAFDLPAGDLKSSRVILVVMPTKKSFLPWRLVSLLGDLDTEFQTSIKNILSVADRLRTRSLSLPVLGERGCMSRENMARLMTSAVKEHVINTEDSTLNCVRIVTLDDKEIREFRKALPLHEVETGQDESTTTHKMIKRGQWMYQDDAGRYMPFDSASNATLEKKYRDSAAHAVISIGSFTYKIDLSKMTQLNKKTGKSRKVQRVDMSPAEKSYQWAYYGDDGKYHNYDDKSNSILEEAWKDQRNVAFVTVSGRAYRVELESRTQTNVSTQKQRPIQRLATVSGELSGDSSKTGDTGASESESHLEKFIVRGQSEDVVAAAANLESILKVERSSKSLFVPNSVYGAFQQEIDIQARRFQVKVKSRLRQDTSIKIELEGASNLVDYAIQAIQVGHTL